MLPWIEEYRPKTIEDMVLPQSILDIVDSMDNGVQNMLFSGKAGTGKTTLARVLAIKYDYDTLFINASKERNIDTLRNKISRFASTVSITSQNKLVILDEADNLNKQSTQLALRAFIEEHSDVVFILTANTPSNIIEPLRSRITEVMFSFTLDKEMMALYYSRTVKILNREGIETFNPKELAILIKKKFPDLRAVINNCQINANKKTKTLKLPHYDVEFGSLKEFAIEYCSLNASFYDIRIFTQKHHDMPHKELFDAVLRQCEIMFLENNPDIIEKAYLLYNLYDYRSSFVTDGSINNLAFLMKLRQVLING